jgi:hypothetical protein
MEQKERVHAEKKKENVSKLKVLCRFLETSYFKKNLNNMY